MLLPKKEIYRENWQQIRTTDEISFKLLGFVPLVSGSGILAVILKAEAVVTPAVILLALFAATITLWLFRWELRNVKNCVWLIKRAQALEATDSHATPPDSPAFFWWSFGKRQAVKAIYSTSILAWLLLPVAAGDGVSSLTLLPDYVWVSYLVLAAVLVVFVLQALLTEVDVPDLADWPADESASTDD